MRESENQSVNYSYRNASLSITDDGEPLGACLYFSATDLEALGVDLSEAEKVVYTIDETTEQLILIGDHE